MNDLGKLFKNAMIGIIYVEAIVVPYSKLLLD